MTTLRDYKNGEYWANTGWIAPWLKEIDHAYWREMLECIGEHWFRRADWKEHVLTEAGQRSLRMQLCTRISQASDVFVPWLKQAIGVDGLQILEIGCGSGSSTAGMAHSGAIVTGVEIKDNSLQMAHRRLSLLGLNASFIKVEPAWLESDVDPGCFAGPYKLVVCYAALEHLLIPERLNLLRLCRHIMERDGAMLATFETPNRFAPFDWHSSKLPFTDVLPDALAFEFAKWRSPRSDHPAKRYAGFSPAAQDNLYRFGRGVSWHEFELAMGLDNLEVVIDGYSPKSQQNNYRTDESYEAALANLFAHMTPPVPRGFCRPSLELLIRFSNQQRI